MAVKRRNKSIYISVYSYTIPAFEPKNPVFPGIFVSKYRNNSFYKTILLRYNADNKSGADGAAV